MPTVKALEEITDERGKKDRRVVVFEDAPSVELSLGIVAAAGIMPGSTIPPDALREAVEQDRLRVAQDEAVKLLSRKDVTEKELRRHLKAKEFPGDVVDTVIAKCREWGYLDDRRFAKHLVNDSIELKKLGPARIKQKLKQRGVPEDLATDAMASAKDEHPAEVEQALRALMSKRRSYARLEPEVARRRMYGFLQRRGFGFDTVKTAVQQMLTRLEDGEGEDDLPL